MEEVCYKCGAVENVAVMESYNLGRRRVYVCPQCYRKADKSVAVRICMRHNMIEAKKNK